MPGTPYNEILARRTISPAVLTDGTVNGAAVDLAQGPGGSHPDGHLSSVVIVTGTITDGSHAVAIEDSADGSTDWQAVAAGKLEGGAAPTIVAANDDTIYARGVSHSRRYLRVSVVTTGATSGGAIAAAVAFKSRTSH